MNLSTSTNICAFSSGRERYPMLYCIEQCAKGGYKALDINFCECMNPNSLMRSDDWESYVEEIRLAGERFGVTFTQSHLPYYDIFANNEEGKVKLMEELIRRSIIASGRLGIRWTVTHPGTVFRADNNMEESLERNVEYYSKHVQEAKNNGLGIALENDFEYKKSEGFHAYCSDISELVKLVDSLNESEYVGASYDFGHANMQESTHRKNLNTIGHRLQAVHVQDNRGQSDEHLLPFHGNIDWKDAMAGLADISFSNDLTFEVQEWGRYYPKELKYLVVEHSIKVGNILLGYYEEALSAKKNGV